MHERHTFEQAIELTGNGLFQMIALWMAGGALLGVIMESLNMGLVLPLARCELKLSNAENGVISAATIIGVMLTSHLWGFLTDTWGRRKVLLMSLGSGFVFSSMSSFAVTGAMLLVTRVLVGMTISGAMAAAISYLGEFHCDRNRRRSLTFVAMFMSSSFCFQGLVGLFIMPMDWKFMVFGMVYRPWRAYILICSMIHAVVFTVGAFMPESPKFMLVMGKPREALDILKIVHRINNGAKKTFSVHEISAESDGSDLANGGGITGMLKIMWHQTKPLLQQPYLHDVTLLCLLSFILFAVCHGLYQWFPEIMSLYLKNEEVSITICAAIDMEYNASMHVSQPVLSNVSILTETSACHIIGDPMIYYTIILSGIVFTAVSSLVALNSAISLTYLITVWMLFNSAAAAALYWTNNLYLNMALMIVVLTNGTVGSIVTTNAGNMVPTQFKGMAVSFVILFGRIGSAVGTNFVAAILHGHCELLFPLTAACILLAAPLCYYTFRTKTCKNIHAQVK